MKQFLSRSLFRAHLLAALAAFPIMWVLAFPYAAVDRSYRRDHLLDGKDFFRVYTLRSIGSAIVRGDRY